MYNDPPQSLLNLLKSYNLGSLIIRKGIFYKDEMRYQVFHRTDFRTQLEDMLFYEFLLPKLQSNKDQIIDGLMPRIVKLYPFDQVIFVEAPEQIRRRNLVLRGVSEGIINDIIEFQNKIYYMRSLYGNQSN